MLYILPFDHRSSFARDLLGKPYPVHGEDKTKLIALREVIFDGLLAAKAQYQGNGTLATIVDEELGLPVIERAEALGVPYALTTESTAHDHFAFIHGDAFRDPFAVRKPAFAKALVYYKMGDEQENVSTRAKLRELSDFCQEKGLNFMLEVLITNEGSKSQWAGTIIDELEAHGIRPAVWKIEALETINEWRELSTHTKAQIIILGRGESKEQVDAWVQTAAASGCVHGFAVGRTIFLQPLKHFVAGTQTREAAVNAIANNYLHYIHLWEKAAK